MKYTDEMKAIVKLAKACEEYNYCIDHLMWLLEMGVDKLDEELGHSPEHITSVANVIYDEARAGRL